MLAEHPRHAGNALPVIGVGLLASLTTSLVAHLLFAGLLVLLSLTALILRRRAA